MDLQAWQRVRSILDDLLTVEEGARPQHVVSPGEGETAARLEVESLLSVSEDALEWLETPLIRIAEPAGQPLGEGCLVDSLRVGEQIGAGGMGVVHAAWDEAHERQVAIKLLHYPAAMASHEAKILARLNHPNVAQLYGSGVLEGRPYLVMEHVAGEPIDLYADRQRLSVADRIALFRKVLLALGYLHRHQVVHRDVKPENILVGVDGEPKLLDFGISRIYNDQEGDTWSVTDLGRRPMTLGVASPEQVAGQQLSTSTDIYSAGVVLYLLLTGSLPYPVERRDLAHGILALEPVRASEMVLREGGRLSLRQKEEEIAPNELATRRAEARPRSLSRQLAGDVDAILLKAIQKEPSARYANAEEFAEDLRRVLAREPVVARSPGRLYTAGRFVRRHPIAAPVVVVSFLISIVASIGFGLQLRETRREVRRAEDLLLLAGAEASNARTVSHFLSELFHAANPLSTASAGEPTVAQLLDRGRSQVQGMRPDSPQRTTIAAAIGLAYMGLGLLDEAENLLAGAMEDAVRSFGPRSLQVAEVRDILGIVERRRGNLEAAEEHLRATLEIQQISGAFPADIADTYDELAMTLFKAGDLAQAESLSRHGIALLEKDPSAEAARLMGSALSNLGLILVDQGRLAEAEDLFTVAVRRVERTHGTSHAGYAAALNNLALVRVEQGRFAEAGEALAKASQIDGERLLEGHQRALVHLNNAAAAAYYAGNYGTAVEAQVEVAELMTANLGAQHPDRLVAVSNLGAFQREAGMLSAARRTLEGAVSGLVSELGDDHWLTANATKQLAQTHGALGEYEAARRLFGSAIEAFKRSLGDHHWRTYSARFDFAELMVEMGDGSDGLAEAGEAVEGLSAALGPQSWRVADAQSRFGGLLLVLGRHDVAEENLLNALATLEAQTSVQPTVLVATLERLVALHVDRGAEGKADAYRRRIAELKAS